MILPSTYQTALLLTILTMLCWGSWANTMKLAGNWRFELFYFDFSFGVLLLATAAAFTFGSMGQDLTFQDNISIARNLFIGYALLAGMIFNLANILLVAAISISGMAVAFPIGIGLALVIGVVWNYFLNAQGNPLFLFGGVALVLLAVLANAKAYRLYARSRPSPPAAAAVQAPSGTSRAAKPARQKPGSAPSKGIFISVVSGLLMGSFYPLVEMSKQTELGLGPYAVTFILAIGVFVSTFVYNLVFMNLPLQGQPIEIVEYFQGTLKQHLLGISGGIIWCTGAVASFVAASSPPEISVGPAVSYAMGQGATLISALWGLFVWKEFKDANSTVKRLLGAMLLLFVAGLTLVSLAPLYVNR